MLYIALVMPLPKSLQDYMCSLVFRVPVRYTASSLNSSANEAELLVCTNVFESCPSIDSFIAAIEKKLSRANIINKARLVVPICILLLCTRSYCVDGSTIENADNSVIEYCWECIEFISIGVDTSLRSWVLSSMQGRSCRDYCILNSKSQQVVPRVEHLPGSMFSSRMKFTRVLPVPGLMHEALWHIDDAVMETIDVHMKVASNFNHFRKCERPEES